MTPAVSVIIPAYNAAAYLPAALESVLTQGRHVLEVLVVDDGSTDGTEDLMSGYGPPVRHLRQRNQGVSAARNRGIIESRGRYVAFLDADDTWLPEKLARQLDALASQPHHGLCYSAFLVVDSQLNTLELRRSHRRTSALEDLLTQGNVVGCVSAVLCEHALLSRAGGFDPTLSQCADWDMWIRIAQLTDFLYIDEPLVTYRQHESNMSHDARLLEQDSLAALNKGFALPGLPARLQKRKRRALARNDTVLAGTYLGAGLWPDALRCAARALVRDPRQSFYLTAYPLRAIRRWLRRGSMEA